MYNVRIAVYRFRPLRFIKGVFLMLVPMVLMYYNVPFWLMFVSCLVWWFVFLCHMDVYESEQTEMIEDMFNTKEDNNGKIDK